MCTSIKAMQCKSINTHLYITNLTLIATYRQEEANACSCYNPCISDFDVSYVVISSGGLSTDVH